MSIGGLDKVKVIANPDWCKKGNYFIMDVAKAGQIIGAPGFPELWDEEPCKIFVCHPDDEQAILDMIDRDRDVELIA